MDNKRNRAMYKARATNKDNEQWEKRMKKGTIEIIGMERRAVETKDKAKIKEHG